MVTVPQCCPSTRTTGSRDLVRHPTTGTTGRHQKVRQMDTAAATSETMAFAPIIAQESVIAAMVICVVDGKGENNSAEQLVELSLSLVSYCLHVPHDVEVVHVIAALVPHQRHRRDIPNTSG